MMVMMMMMMINTKKDNRHAIGSIVRSTPNKLHINNLKIEQVNSFKLLGVRLQSISIKNGMNTLLIFVPKLINASTF